jgi:hemerythrin-like domain-containing protein
MPIQIGRRPDHGFDEPLGLLSDCHRRIEHFLAVLLALVQHDSRGPLEEARRKDLEAALTYFATAAPRHTADEEESLFPRLRESDDRRASEAFEVIARLERDHDEAALRHADVDRLGRLWLTRVLEDQEIAALQSNLERLQALYAAHIAVEDRELFPAAARVLSAEQIQAVGREMAARRAAVTRK